VWREKWAGFSLVRADVVIRLQVNATPFHQGKLLMHYLPMSIAMASVSPAYAAMHTFDLTTKRMLPCVEMDAMETAAEITIPYITPANYYGLAPTGSSAYPKYDRGSLDVSVLAPLRIGPTGATSVDYSLYVHFCNVELVAPLVPQSSAGKRYKARKLGKAEAEKELDSMKSGPISSALSSASTIASSLAAVPFLEAIATPASWVLAGASGIASFFGYSKPTNDVAPILAARIFNRYAATSDGVDPALPLAIRADNKVTLLRDKTIYDQDEMSFAFLKKVETVVNVVTWSTSQAQNAVVFTETLTPSQLFTTKTVTRGSKTVTARTGPPIWYLSHLFKQWRGSIKMRMKVAKTNFHSGRLQLTYTPKHAPTTLPNITTTGQYAIREILDIRVGDEVEFVFPYLAATDYISLTDSIGTFEVRVLNALRAPETVSPTVDLLFYWSGGDDLEFAIPGYRDGVFNYPPFSPEMNSGTGTLREGPTTLATGTPGMVSEGPVTMTSAEYCVGEMFSSIRQLLLRMNQVWWKTPPTGTNYYFWPFFSANTRLDATLGITSANLGGDVFSFLSPMYVFYRGGMRVGISSDVNTVNFVSTLHTSIMNSGGNVIGTSTAANGSSAAVDWTTFPSTTIPNGTCVTDALGVVSLSVPYYSRTPVSLNCPISTGVAPAVSGSLEISQASSAVLVRGMADVSKSVLYRSIAEDFQFQFFVGCPPLVVAAPALAGALPVPFEAPPSRVSSPEDLVGAAPVWAALPDQGTTSVEEVFFDAASFEEKV
jgi:hypothetical protein